MNTDYREYKEKINFVRELNDAIIKVQHNIDKIHYDVFTNETGKVEEEYLVVKYIGGAVTARNCYGNSCYAIFEEISKYLEHCYYYELDNYKKILNNSDLKLLTF